MKALDLDAHTAATATRSPTRIEANLHWFDLNGIKPGMKIDPVARHCSSRSASHEISMPLPIDYHNHPQAHSVQPYTPELLQPWADAARQRG